MIRHPRYSFARKKDDIALVEFSGNVEFNDVVRPACIRTDINDVPESEELLITGWGSIETESNTIFLPIFITYIILLSFCDSILGTNRSEILLKANVSSVPLILCNQTLLEYNRLAQQPSLQGLSGSQMCALNALEHKDACQGDSGGPIFLYHESGVSTIVGIVSFGISCASSLPAVYTRIASYTDWIENMIWP